MIRHVTFVCQFIPVYQFYPYLRWLDNAPAESVYPRVTQLDLAVALIKLLTVEEGKGSPAMTSG